VSVVFGSAVKLPDRRPNSTVVTMASSENGQVYRVNEPASLPFERPDRESN
jgi:hypothetical protein